MPSTTYIIVSAKHTKNGDRFVTLWGADNRGYTYSFTQCGRYSSEDVEGHSGYYDNGVSAFAVPAEIVAAHAEPTIHPGSGDDLRILKRHYRSLVAAARRDRVARAKRKEAHGR